MVINLIKPEIIYVSTITILRLRLCGNSISDRYVFYLERPICLRATVLSETDDSGRPSTDVAWDISSHRESSRIIVGRH